MRLVFCKISSTNVLIRGLTKYNFVWGSSHCSMKSGLELIYRSINSVYNHILPIWDMSKFHIRLFFFLGWDMLLLT